MQMATPKTAMALLEELRNASFATAQNELTVLRDFAATQVSIWMSQVSADTSLATNKMQHLRY